MKENGHWLKTTCLLPMSQWPLEQLTPPYPVIPDWYVLGLQTNYLGIVSDQTTASTHALNIRTLFVVARSSRPCLFPFLEPSRDRRAFTRRSASNWSPSVSNPLSRSFSVSIRSTRTSKPSGLRETRPLRILNPSSLCSLKTTIVAYW